MLVAHSVNVMCIPPYFVYTQTCQYPSVPFPAAPKHGPRWKDPLYSLDLILGRDVTVKGLVKAARRLSSRSLVRVAWLMHRNASLFPFCFLSPWSKWIICWPQMMCVSVCVHLCVCNLCACAYVYVLVRMCLCV